MRFDGLNFLCGVLAGAMGIILLALFFDLTSSSVYRKYTIEAVQLGYGKWVIDTNKFGGNWSPETRFEWITNIVEKK